MQNVNKQQYQKTDPRWMDNSSNIEAKTRWNQVRKGRNGTKNGWRPSNTVIKLGKNTTVASRRGMLMRRGADGRSWRDQQGAIFQDRMLSLSQERERERERERESQWPIKGIEVAAAAVSGRRAMIKSRTEKRPSSGHSSPQSQPTKSENNNNKINQIGHRQTSFAAKKISFKSIPTVGIVPEESISL